MRTAQLAQARFSDRQPDTSLPHFFARCDAKKRSVSASGDRQVIGRQGVTWRIDCKLSGYRPCGKERSTIFGGVLCHSPVTQ